MSECLLPYSASVCLPASAYASPLSVANTEMAAKWLDDEQTYALCTNHLAHKSNHATCLQAQLMRVCAPRLLRKRILISISLRFLTTQLYASMRKTQRKKSIALMETIK